MPTAVISLISLLQYAPSAINEISALYAAIRDTFSPSDQETIDEALAAAIAADAAATKAAGEALDAAAKR